MGAVNSLTNQFFLWREESEFFNPSKYELIKARSEGDDRLLDAVDKLITQVAMAELQAGPFKPISIKRKVSTFGFVTKSLRAIARTVYTLAVTLLISPVGALFHGTNSLYFAAAGVFQWSQGENDWATKHWAKAALHVKAFAIDFLFSSSNVIVWPMLVDLIQAAPIASLIAAGILNPLVSLGGLVVSREKLMGFTSCQVARGWKVAQYLRDEHGYVGADGKLLNYSNVDSESDDVGKLFTTLHQKKSEEFLDCVRELYTKIPESHQLNLRASYPPHWENINHNAKNFRPSDESLRNEIYNLLLELHGHQLYLKKLHLLRSRLEGKWPKNRFFYSQAECVKRVYGDS